jgi:glycosyltransferase involved in cell wall biosynthesis
LTRIPYLLTAHLGDVPGGVPQQTDQLFKIVKPLTLPIWRSAAHVTAVSSFVAELAKRAYAVSAQVILNGVRLPERQSKKEHQIPQLLLVGRLSVQKNPLLAIQTLALLRASPWRLKIIGDGPLAEAVHREIEQLDLQERISCVGWLSADEVRLEMEKADLLLMPSLSEGLPMVAVEALAHHLAIVGSRIGGLHDIIIEGKNGALFDLQEGASGMAEALRPFLENRELLAAAQEASWRNATQFEWSRSIDLYEEMLTARQSSCS